ncbi:MAG: lamin tail domain-containing protein, partial [Deltaproteobacteria bacterium]|nr:lamin tail domain-containing protein [Deltaproteobacteria bacterium]
DTYYFYIKAGDEKPNWSGLSNKATAWAKITPPPTPTTVVISQIGEDYDGTAAPDYVELYNTTNQDIDLSLYSIQRDAAALDENWGAVSFKVSLGTIPAYGFYLVGDEGSSYPVPPDVTHASCVINDYDMIALVSNNTDITGFSDPDIIDFVGLAGPSGSAGDYEGGGAAPDPNAGYTERLSQLGDSAADLQDGGNRALFGNSYDTNENVNDFVRDGAVTKHLLSKPQNSESPHEIPSTPTISGFTPDTGPVGTTVTINGTYFGAVRKSSNTYSHIYFYNGVEADYTIGDFIWCDTKVVVGVPAGAETGKIWFCTQDDFTYHTGTSTVDFTIGATEDTTPPCAISNLTALTALGGHGGRITLKWSEPGDDGESSNNSAGQYLVKYSSNYISSSDFYASWVSTWGYYTPGAVPGAETSKVLTGLDEGTTYFFAIRTKDSDDNWSIWPGTSTNINSLSFSVPTDSAPATITSLSALTGDSGGEVDLTWLVPGDDGTSGAITGGKFSIRYATYTGVDWTTASSEWNDFNDKYELEIDTDTSAYGEMHGRTMTSLHEGVTYYFRIKTGDEKPNWSGLSNHATAQAYTTLDTGLPCAISDLTALTGTSAGEIQLKWSAPGDDGTMNNNSEGSYLVKYASRYIDTGYFDAAWVSTYTQSWTPDLTPGNEELRTLTGFKEGTTYWFVMKASDSDSNQASWTSSGTVSTVNTLNSNFAKREAPSAITNLSALLNSSLTASQCKLTWTAPGDDGTKNGGATSYDIKFATKPFLVSDWDSSWVIQSATEPASPKNYGGSETITITQLTMSTTYYFRIKSIDDAGNVSDIDTTSVQAFVDMRPDLMLTG